MERISAVRRMESNGVYEDDAPVMNGKHLVYKSCFFGDLKPRFFSAQKKWGFRKARLFANPSMQNPAGRKSGWFCLQDERGKHVKNDMKTAEKRINCRYFE